MAPRSVLALVAVLAVFLVALPVDGHRQGLRTGYERMLYDCSHDWGWESGKPADRGHELVALDIDERVVDGVRLLLLELNMARGLPDSSGLPYQAWETLSFQTPRLAISTTLESTKETVLTHSEGLVPDYIGPLKPGVTQGGGEDDRLLAFDIGYTYDRLQVQNGERVTGFHVQGWFEDLDKRVPGDHMAGGFQNPGDPRHTDLEGCYLPDDHDPKKDETYYMADGYTVASSDWTIGSAPAGNATATDLPPVADFSVGPQRPSRIEEVRFVDKSRAGSTALVSFAWDLGDGTNGTGAETLHTYPKLGKYEVTLRVTDAAGRSAEVRKGVHVVNVRPVASFELPNGTLEMGRAIRFVDGSSDPDGRILYRTWDLGDGTTIEGPSVEHTFTEAGQHTVTLVVTDDNGATNTTQRTLVLSGAADVSVEAPALPWSTFVFAAAFLALRRRSAA